MSFVRQLISKMADKLAAAYHFASVGCCGHSNLVIFNPIHPNFINSLLISNPDSSSNMSVFRQTITKVANKMAAAYQYASVRCCGHSYLVILIEFLPNFIYGLLPSNPGLSSNMSFV